MQNVKQGVLNESVTQPTFLGLPTPLGLWEDDNVDGCWSSPGHEGRPSGEAGGECRK